MTDFGSKQKLKFGVHASVIFQLGESLITDVTQALLELVKNSYDADASWIEVKVATQEILSGDYYYSGTKGFITLYDNGVGMDWETIRDGWLTISYSPKREMKKKGLTTGKNRTPLGDKGLGRLGVQRLGNNIEIITKPNSSDIEYRVSFSWKDFETAVKVEDVDVHYEERITTNMPSGTKIIISDLKNVEQWKGYAVDKLQIDLSKLISPYREARNFIIVATIDGRILQLAELSEEIRETAHIRYQFLFDGQTLTINGKAKLEYFRPQGDEDSDSEGIQEALKAFRNLVEADKGARFFSYLQNQRISESYNLIKSKDPEWFIEFSKQRDLYNSPGVKLNYSEEIANPGPFRGEIDSFNLRSAGNEILSKSSEFRNYIKDLSGIRVYRDGFGIRVDADWLKLSEQQTFGRSFYGLRPANTIGYIALSAKENAVLEEKTDREGFKDTPYYSNFYYLMQEFVKFTGDVQSFVRRNWNKFRKSPNTALVIKDEIKTPEQLVRNLGDGLTNLEENLRQTQNNLERTIIDTRNTVKVIESSLPLQTIQSLNAQNSMNNLEQAAVETKRLLSQVTHEVTQRKVESEILEGRIGVIREQLDQSMETVSLGLTAEALAHEIRQIANQLAERNNLMISYLKKAQIKDNQIELFTQYIKSSVNALRKQLSHLTPSLRFARETKENLNLISFLESEIKNIYTPRFERYNCKILLKDTNSKNFILNINRGKLTQVIDNLLLNSEYWLREDIRLKRIKEGVVTIDIDKPFIRVSDNGLGIEPNIESSLFEPFITAKPSGVGRGLGLFVTQQLLETIGSFISLLPNRNKNNRRYIFEINLIGALIGND